MQKTNWIFSFTIASCLIFSCVAPPSTSGSASTDVPTSAPTETIVEETETSIPVEIEAQNVFSFDEMGISIGFNYPENFNQGVNTSVLGVYEPNAPFELAYPQHARVLFTAYAGDATTILAEGIRVFRAADIDALEAGVIENLAATLEGHEDHRSDFPRLAGAGSTIDDQFVLLDFQNGTGFRFLNSKSFDASSLRSTQTTFLYQGMTNDGKYFVSVVFGVDAPFLADLVDAPLSTPEEFETYYQIVRERINNAQANDFIPSLDMIDSLIKSIIIIEKEN